MSSAITSISGNSSSAVTSSNDANSSRKAQLEKQLATYVKELAEAEKDASSKEGALRLQLLQQQILAIQQQIAQLSVSSSTQVNTATASPSSTTTATVGNIVNIAV